MAVFLRARWCDVVIASYAVAEGLLLPYLPDGLELDKREGSAWASLVAFDFAETRVLGVRWPGFVRFPEWNLRFYVREGERRGVVFVREFVPSRLVAGIARWGYNEPYQNAQFEQKRTAEHVSYGVRFHESSARIAAEIEERPVSVGEESWEAFFKEHEWGYGRTRGGKRLTYEVRHAEWRVYPVKCFAVELDWGAMYGKRWAVMNGIQPFHFLVAEGSPVTVSFPLR